MAYTLDPEAVGFVYRWHDSSNGMYYIGSHKGSPDDGYLCSSKYMKNAYNKRPESFYREIMYTGKNFVELEDLILRTLDVAKDEKSYNLMSFATFNASGVKRRNDTRKKQSDARIGMKFTEQHKSNVSKALKGSARRAVPLLELSTGIIYEQVRHYAEASGKNYRSLVQAISNYRKTGHKYPIIYDIELAPKIRFRKNK